MSNGSWFLLSMMMLGLGFVLALLNMGRLVMSKGKTSLGDIMIPHLVAMLLMGVGLISSLVAGIFWLLQNTKGGG